MLLEELLCPALVLVVHVLLQTHAWAVTVAGLTLPMSPMQTLLDALLSTLLRP